MEGTQSALIATMGLFLDDTMDTERETTRVEESLISLRVYACVCFLVHQTVSLHYLQFQRCQLSAETRSSKGTALFLANLAYWTSLPDTPIQSVQRWQCRPCGKKNRFFANSTQNFSLSVDKNDALPEGTRAGFYRIITCVFPLRRGPFRTFWLLSPNHLTVCSFDQCFSTCPAPLPNT